MNKITILGSGTSTGVPILGCNCQVCQSNDPRNSRLRTSALLQTKSGKNILIDASPDLRTQLLQEKVNHIDGVIITHDHADHTHGMDDLRPFGFKQQKPLPVYTDTQTSSELRQKFPYIFQREKVYSDKPILGGGIPLLDLETITDDHVSICGEPMDFFNLPHGHHTTLGIRHKSMAYITDCRSIPDETLKSLHDARLQILIIDCLRPKPHQTHLHFDLTLQYIEAISPLIAVLTHMGHEWEYLDLLSRIRDRGLKNVFPAIDRQSFLYS